MRVELGPRSNSEFGGGGRGGSNRPATCTVVGVDPIGSRPERRKARICGPFVMPEEGLEPRHADALTTARRRSPASGSRFAGEFRLDVRRKVLPDLASMHPLARIAGPEGRLR